MKHLYLPVSATAPLSIRSDHGQEGATTTYAIPGTTVLGSLAAAHRMLRPENDEEFSRFFLNERVSMPYLYPASFKMDRFQKSNLPVMPLPKTAQTCKRFSGFRPLRGADPGEDPDKKGHGIRDSLFDWAVFSLLRAEEQAIPALLTVLEAHKECAYTGSSAERCGQTMDHATGYYRRDRSHPEQRMMAQIETHLQTRTGINRTWGVVEEGILYNREVFDETMRFWGEIILPDELSDTFMQFLDEAVKEDVIRIGTGRTRGLGRVEITKLPLPEAQREELASFEQRLQRFNNALRQQAQVAGVKTQYDFYFAITLRSATILCDKFLRYCTTLEADTFASELNRATLEADTLASEQQPGTFEKLYQATETQRITGWNELWGTPRPNYHALAMGSTFLFACTHPLDGNLLQALYTLEETGLGRRRAEGFGRICISDPFHLEGEQA
ncbi:MAG: RAMP superfamily CRISPR-associated protein [Chloroflexota bacterium]|nr:RAMP superfamily CRISPR-associated protein [Chloroflexota bacterium]